MNEILPRSRPAEKQCADAAEIALRDSFGRGPAKTEIREAIHRLNNRLVDNSGLYLRGDLQSQRDAVANTLQEIEAFLADQGISKMALLPILRPVQALVERENNTLDPMFARRATGMKPKRTLDKLNRIGILAALADAWLSTNSKEGRDQNALLREAARAFKGRWFAGLTKAQLKTARDFVSQTALQDTDHLAVKQARLTEAQIKAAAEQYGAKNAIFVVVQSLNACPRSFAFGNEQILEPPSVSSSDDS